MGPVLRAQPDRRLVDLVRDGYDAAFEEIVRRYRRPLDRFAAAFVGHRSEDVTQDAFSKALLALRGSEAEIELRPWLYRIVRNTALNDLRAAAPATAELSETMPGARSAAAEVESREELRDLMERLGALPETQRAALVMRELEGLSHEEIAAALGVSGGAARQAIFRARAALREGFGLLVPLPVLRALADHGGEAGAAGAGVALGGGALKAGMATVLIAGAVGAGVAVRDHHGRAGPEAAEAAPLVGGKQPGAGARGATAQQSFFSTGEGSHGRGERSGDGRGHEGSGSGDGGSGSLGSGDRSGSSGAGSSGDRSHSGSTSHSGSGSGGPGPSSGDVSGSGDRHGGSSGSDDGGSSSGSGSGSDDGGVSGSGDGGTSGGSGSDDGLVSSGDGGSSGPNGSGDLTSEPTTTGETTLSDDNSGSGDSSSGSGSSDGGGETTTSTSGSGDLSGTDSTSGSDGSP